MSRYWLSGLLTVALIGGAVRSQDETKEEPKAQPALKAGAIVPGAFEALNITGVAQGRPHCLVCRFQQKPVMMVFAKEPQEGKEVVFQSLIKKMEDAVEENVNQELSGFVVVLAPELKVPGSGDEPSDQDKLGVEAKSRDELVSRLKKQGEKFKNVVLAAYSEKGPAAYKLDPQAEFTLVFYDRLKIVTAQTFPEGKLDDAAIDGYLDKVKSTLKKNKKR